MLLSPEEAKLFFRLHNSLMKYANDSLNVVTSGRSLSEYAALPLEARMRVVQAFLGRLDLIEAFVAENPAGLSRDEMEIVSAWRFLVPGKFLVLRQLKKHMIFLSSKEPAVAYGVLGLADPLDLVIGPHLPAMVETVLLPFRGRIIYDGLAGRFNVTFGGGAKRSFEDSYRVAKARHGIVTSLPLEAASQSAGGGQVAPVAPKARRAEAERAASVAPGRSAARLYQFKITLVDIEPPIWRRIQVLDGTVDKLHEHIQAAMGWTNSHLHQFYIDGTLHGDPELLKSGAERFDGENSTRTLISEVMPHDGAPFRFSYEYDFGDSWNHEVKFEGNPQPQPGVEYPLCLEGARACPPEDVGGTTGYADYVEALGDPTHERHEELLQWNGDFKPEAFNPRRATQAMQEGLPDWRTMA